MLIEEGLREGAKMLKQALYATPELAKVMLLGEKIAAQIDINNFLNPDGTLDVNSLEDYIQKNYQNELSSNYVTAIVAAIVGVIVAVVAVVVVDAFWVIGHAAPNVLPASINVAEMLPVNSSLRMDKLVDEIAVNYKK